VRQAKQPAGAGTAAPGNCHPRQHERTAVTGLENRVVAPSIARDSMAYAEG